MAGRRSRDLGQPRYDAPGPSARRFASARSAPRDDARCRLDPRRGGLKQEACFAAARRMGRANAEPTIRVRLGWHRRHWRRSRLRCLDRPRQRRGPREGHIMTAPHDWAESGPHNSAAAIDRRQLLLLSAFGLVAGAPALGAEPKGALTWGVHVSLAPTWFDPAEA